LSAGEHTATVPVTRKVERETAAYLALLATATIWGTTPVGAKSALDTYSPFTLSIGRWLIALAVILVLMRRAGVRPILDWRTGVLGLFGIFGFNAFFTFGLERTSAANGALLGGALPVVVAVISFLVLGERLSPLRWSGIAMSMVGVAVTVLGATLDASVLGNVLVFCAVLSWAIYTIFQRQRLRGEPIMGIISGSAMIGMVLMIPFAVAEWLGGAPPAPSLGLAVVILYLSLGPALAANYMWVFALGRVPASLAAVFSNLAPIVGIVAAGVILDEPITRYHVLGGLLVIIGVLMTTLRRHPGGGQEGRR
jgi:drug/metabolite transporter (DMT)-like permease